MTFLVRFVVSGLFLDVCDIFLGYPMGVCQSEWPIPLLFTSLLLYLGFHLLGYTSSMRPLRPFALEVFFSKWEFTARYNLCASDMQSMTLSELLAIADATDRAAWERLYLGYTETWGSPDRRGEAGDRREVSSPKYCPSAIRNNLTFS